MKHITHVSATRVAPVQASLLVWQQKAVVASAFASAVAAWGNSLGVWQGLLEDKNAE